MGGGGMSCCLRWFVFLEAALGTVSHFHRLYFLTRTDRKTHRRRASVFTPGVGLLEKYS